MKRKGFTLAELMGVITILGLIVLIALPPLIKQIKGTKTTIDEATEKLIIIGAENYVDENKNDYPRTNGNTYCITLQTLVDDNKLSKDLKDSDGNSIDLNKYIKVTVIHNNYNYDMVNSCTSN